MKGQKMQYKNLNFSLPASINADDSLPLAGGGLGWGWKCKEYQGIADFSPPLNILIFFPIQLFIQLLRIPIDLSTDAPDGADLFGLKGIFGC